MVSNYVHNLNIGQTLSFMHNEHCLGKMDYPLPKDITSITMIAVGAGIAPMFRIIRALLDSNQKCEHVANIRLLYGARTVSDILLREQLDQWHDSYDSNCNGNNDNDDSKKRFQVCYCIGSRWNNIHFHAKSNDQRQGPPLPKDWDTVPDDRKELGWVDGDKVQRRSASTADDPGHRIFICGLPGVYLKLAGSRFNTQVEEGTQLYKLGYRDHQVVKF